MRKVSAVLARLSPIDKIALIAESRPLWAGIKSSPE
jgi:hypothetical protein